MQRINVRHPLSIFIGGEWVEPSTDRVFDIISPTTEQSLTTVAEAREGDIDRAVAAAREAFDNGPWPKMRLAERAKFIRALTDALHSRSDDLSRAWTEQIGVVHHFAQATTHAAIGLLEDQLALTTQYNWEELVPTVYSGCIGLKIQEPVGVVAAIVPWNAPLFSTLVKLAPALMAGCTLVLKPAPETPLEAYILVECAEAAGIPPGVINLVTADRTVADYLVRKAEIDKVSFTGSTSAGRRIASVCGDRIARYTLELGGKSPAIILDDYDIDKAAMELASTLTTLSGQVCANLTRYIVPERKHDAFVQSLATRLQAIQIGNPYDPQSQMGPLATRRQRERVEGYIERALNDGAAELVTGGCRPAHLNRGFFLEPTLFANVDNRSSLAQEEIFGPVGCVTKYSDLDDAIRLANETIFGLNGSVFTDDPEKAYHVARSVRSGTIGQNASRMDFSIAFGGFKQSGIGREGGSDAVKHYLETKTVVLEKSAADLVNRQFA